MDLRLTDPQPFWRHVAQKIGHRDSGEAGAAVVFPMVCQSARSCPLCFVLLDLEAYAMAPLPLAVSQDFTVRHHLAVDARLCNHHAWYLCRLGASADVIALAGAWLAEMIPPADFRPGLRSAGRLNPCRRDPDGPGECAVCTVLTEEARRLCAVLIEALESPALPDAYAELRLCIPHCAEVLALAAGAVVRQRLVRAQARGMIAMIEEIATVQLQVARRSRNLGCLRDVHGQAIEMCVGMPGLRKRQP